MKIYLVGGAVRDKLLGLPIKEKDWVIVGATSEEMLALGYRQVGKDFPVFLHPETKEEYALARKERKIQAGYSGFEFDTSRSVTLEADLARRDLTINAMAETETGILIDPYHGKKDLDDKQLRHVSPAFAEDPVRILRVGRFLARYAYLGFTIAPETITLMQEIVAKKEVNALVPERVWKELERALGEPYPEKFFEVLAAACALPVLFPGLSMTGEGLKALAMTAKLTPDTQVRFAALMHALPEVDTANRIDSLGTLCRHYRVPSAYSKLAQLVSSHHLLSFEARQLSPELLLNLLSQLDIFRRESRFHQFLIACQGIALAKNILFDPTWLMKAAQLARAVDAQTYLKQGFTDKALAEQLKSARIERLNDWLNQ